MAHPPPHTAWATAQVDIRAHLSLEEPKPVLANLRETAASPRHLSLLRVARCSWNTTFVSSLGLSRVSVER